MEGEGSSSFLPIRHRNIAGEREREMIEQEVTTCSEKVCKYAKKKFPITTWSREYRKSYILADLIAGITVWLTAVPQSMAYAAIAGLTPEYGLYSHFIGPFVYIFMGPTRQVTIGPTAVIELVSFQTCGEGFPDCVVLLGFYAGIIELVFGFLHLGLLISFVSEPTVVGFTAGASLTIASAQVKNLLGLEGRANGSGFYATWRHIIEKFSTIKLGDTVLGVLCIMFLLTFQKLKDVKPPERFSNSARWKKILETSALARNALVVIVGTLVAFIWSNPAPFKLTGKVQSGFPPVGPPSFELIRPNSNSTQPMTALETMGFIGSSCLSIAVISILQNVAISKAFGSGQKIDGTQEMVTLGVTNIIGGFFSCLPTSGSFSRSAINDASGVKSQLGGLFVGILILLSLGFLTPAFQYIPKASLAAVVICAVLFMIEFHTVFLIWKTSKIDFFCCLLTFIVSLIFGMEYGIVAGVGVSSLIILLKSLRPAMLPQLLIDPETKLKYVLLKPNQGFQFHSLDYVRDTVNKLAVRYANSHPVIVIQCDKWSQFDFSTLNGLAILGKNLNKNGKTLILYKSEMWKNELTICFGAQYPICCPHKDQLYSVFRELKLKDYKSSSSEQHSLESINNSNSSLSGVTQINSAYSNTSTDDMKCEKNDESKS